MKCSKCNNEIQNGFKFCPICGTPVPTERKCPKCGATDIPHDSKFCPDCGVLLGIDQEEAQRRFEEAKKLEAEKARRRKQAESAKQQEIARKKELERKIEEEKRKAESVTKRTTFEEKAGHGIETERKDDNSMSVYKLFLWVWYLGFGLFILWCMIMAIFAPS